MSVPANLYPGLNDISDVLEELPLEVSRYMTLLYEIDAKCVNIIPELNKCIQGFLDGRNVDDDKKVPLRVINQWFQELIPSLEEKMHVSSIAYDSLERLTDRLELAYEVALSNQEIPEKLRLGNDNHPAMHLHRELMAKVDSNAMTKSQQALKSESRREAMAAKRTTAQSSNTVPAAVSSGSNSSNSNSTANNSSNTNSNNNNNNNNSNNNNGASGRTAGGAGPGSNAPNSLGTTTNTTNGHNSGYTTTAGSRATGSTPQQSQIHPNHTIAGDDQHSTTTTTTKKRRNNNGSATTTANGTNNGASASASANASAAADSAAAAIATTGVGAQRRGKKRAQTTTVTAPKYQNRPKTNEYGEALYCYCNQVAYGEMVGCDGENCQLEWFHLPCIGLETLPKGKWYCNDCLKKQ
ncbi:transcriptional regulatory protein PHO23 [Kluyveromyces marxianus]|uniref:Chromatin modification-related protein n=1 Tax=Kluyveromyces marxianus TaxID=4911 RepID=A0ABX6F018_KLUMA|nr:transcriptional regulatory protein PHO23 [Kluyveromyces marxianus]BAP73920.1 transcriptional regulatory protein PHO23 [Kluyveromyces marxianus]